jgi:hypothetical protein
MSILRTNQITNTAGTGSPSFPNGIAGSVLQVKNFQTGAMNTGTTTIPIDDTIPQNTEGTEFMTLSITPKSSLNTLQITHVGSYECGTADRNLSCALFQDDITNALAAISPYRNVSRDREIITLTHTMVAGTTNEITFKIRVGANASSTITFNGSGGARYFGGVSASSITIMEIGG